MTATLKRQMKLVKLLAREIKIDAILAKLGPRDTAQLDALVDRAFELEIDTILHESGLLDASEMRATQLDLLAACCALNRRA